MTKSKCCGAECSYIDARYPLNRNNEGPTEHVKIGPIYCLKCGKSCVDSKPTDAKFLIPHEHLTKEELKARYPKTEAINTGWKMKTSPDGSYELEPLSDEAWAKDLAYARVSDPDDTNFHTESILLGLAEGRKRNQAEAEARYPELTTLIPKMAEGEQCWLGHSASIALHQFIGQREEAAAREMAEMVVKDCQYRSLDMSVEWLMQEFKKWKQRKGQGGVGL